MKNLLLFICLILFFCCTPQIEITTITQKRTVHIPVYVIENQLSTNFLTENPGFLFVTAAAEDALPLGPEGFDVLDNGGFVITDPIQKRLVLYDSLGNFQDQITINFAVNSVTVGDNGNLEIRKSNSGDIYVYDRRGILSLPEDKKKLRSYQIKNVTAKLLGDNRGIIIRPTIMDTNTSYLEITFESDSTQMISLQHLGTDRKKNTFVALETTSGGDIIDVKKIIRKYGSDTILISQIIDIPLDYYVFPTTEFRIKNGRVYQLFPRKTEVVINIWDMN